MAIPMMENSWLCLVYFVVFLVLAVKLKSSQSRKKINLPPSPLSFPIIGHLHLLKQPLHRTFDNLAKKYGPVVSVRLGSRLAVIVSSPSAAEECLTKNDIVLANRPIFTSGKYLYYNNTTLASASYGDHWRHLRKLCTIEIFSTSRLNSFRDIRKEEVRNLLNKFLQETSHGSGKVVVIRPMFFDMNFNMVLRMITGKQYDGEDAKENAMEARMFREMMQDFSELTTVTNLGDLSPILKWTDIRTVKKLILVGSKMDSFFQRLVDEHRADCKDRNAMIDRLLALQLTEPEYYTDEIIKGLVLVMMAAGTRTSALTLEWTISNLLNNPEVLNKAKKELDNTTGEDRLLDESDISKLPYLRNIITESLRLYPVAPLLVPHCSSASCTIGGYDVPAGTMVFINAWGIQRDPEYWEDATSFKPERFDESHDAYKLMPFGLGRRACPGEGLAHRMMMLTLGSLLQCFELERVGEAEVEMAEKAATLMQRANPLEVKCKARPCLSKLPS